MILPVLLSVLLSAPQAQPNVIIISIDTLRADHLGMYGHPHDTSPHLDAWAEDAMVFDNMLAEIPLTSPSFCSMMSSLNPRITGSTRNGLRLPDEVQTVAQQFKGAGYETVCVTSNWTLKAPLSGLDRGFDIYDDDFHKKRWGFLKSERDADEVTRLSLEILAKRDTQKPLFAWFHYSDPHAPYKKHRRHIVSKRSDYPNDKGAKIKVRYDSEIHYTDSEIRKVMEQLPKENTFILFVVDHGESIHEHDYLGHGRRIYQTGLRVPLAISGPGIDSGRSEAPVRGIDVGPTLLGLAGIPVPEAMRGLDVLNDEIPSNRVRVMETYGGAVPDLGITKSLMAGAKAQRQTVIHEGWKLIIGGSEKGLYHIAEDPLETNNLYQPNPEKVAALTLLWEEWDTNTARNLENDATLTDDDIQALDDLGYVGE